MIVASDPTILSAILAALAAFVTDPRTLLIALFIFLDIGTGLMAALRTGTWDWGLVATFYRSLVVPYVLGYAIFYIVAGVAADLMQSTDPNIRPALIILSTILEQLVQYGGFLAIITTLGASIVRNLGEVRSGQAVGPLRAAVAARHLARDAAAYRG